MPARDSQRQRLYDSEFCLREIRVSKAATKHLIDTEYGSYGSRYPSVAATQAYVDEVLSARWFQSRWGRRSITVTFSRGGSHAYGTGWIEMGSEHRRAEEVILHEIAHTLTPGSCANHGPEFAGILMTLVRNQMGKESADTLRASFRKHRVKVSMKHVPAPASRPVVTKAQRAAKTATRNAEAEVRMTRSVVRTEASAVIRANVKAGLFGPSGSKPRTHALATARLLEKGGR